MTIYFTSDPHYYHANIIKYCNRPYNSVEHMNEELINNWNYVVTSEDTVYCLGDFSFAPRPVELFSQRLNGHKILVPGNHDPIHPYNKHYKKALKQGTLKKLFKLYEDNGWEVLPIDSTLDIPGVAVVNLNHMPYDTTDQRYLEYKPINDKRWLLCGHVHEKWRVRDKMINVGVDVWEYSPVALEQISKIITSEDTAIWNIDIKVTV